MPNLHSHAFHMAWLALQNGADHRLTVSGVGARSCRFALTMTPEQAEAVALRLYVDMLEAGFTRVGEFHYLHHIATARHMAISRKWRIALLRQRKRWHRPDLVASALCAFDF